jgi:hypothetical protein
MREPQVFNKQEWLVHPFVISAGTTALQAACELLFIHGSDLTWGADGFGLFLVDVNTDDRFDAVIQVAEARSKLNLSSAAGPILSKLQPHLIKMAADVARELGDDSEPGAREKIIGRVVGSGIASEQAKLDLDRLAPQAFGLNEWMTIADAVASSRLRSALQLRKRQLASTGKTDEEYQNMLDALAELNLLNHVAWVAYPQDNLNLEISVASQGQFKATAAVQDASTIEWLRLQSEFADLKRGQEKALPLFIAAFINGHHAGPRQAFANAQYGASNAPELDVVIPSLAMGFEVKLYQSPFAQTDNKLVTLANQLKRQLVHYAKAGCRQMVYVCNLSQEMADQVLTTAKRDAKVTLETMAVGGGLGSLLPLLNGVVKQLEISQQAHFEHLVQTHLAGSRPKRKRGKR